MEPQVGDCLQNSASTMRAMREKRQKMIRACHLSGAEIVKRLKMMKQ